MKTQNKSVTISVTIILSAVMLTLGILLINKMATLQDSCDRLRTDLSACNLQLAEVTNTQRLVDQCMNDAYDIYLEQWLGYCEINEIEIVDDSCIIPISQANAFDESLQAKNDACIARYK